MGCDDKLGWVLGSSVGVPDGLKDGGSVGADDGVKLGSCVGSDDGGKLGDIVGLEDGSIVGETVGASTGVVADVAIRAPAKCYPGPLSDFGASFDLRRRGFVDSAE